MRSGDVLPALREGSGCAWCLPGHRGDAPAHGACAGGMHGVRARQGASKVKRPCARRCAWPSARAPGVCGERRQRSTCVAPHPRLVLTGQRQALSPLLAEDGRRAQSIFSVAAHATTWSLHASLRRREHLKTCVVQPRKVGAVRRQSRQRTRPFADDARHPKAEKKQTNPLVGVVCPLTTGGLIRVRRGLWTVMKCLPLQRPEHPILVYCARIFFCKLDRNHPTAV